jgi:hypothetical protein
LHPVTDFCGRRVLFIRGLIYLASIFEQCLKQILALVATLVGDKERRKKEKRRRSILLPLFLLFLPLLPLLPLLLKALASFNSSFTAKETSGRREGKKVFARRVSKDASACRLPPFLTNEFCRALFTVILFFTVRAAH